VKIGDGGEEGVRRRRGGVKRGRGLRTEEERKVRKGRG
jgi:hypothetical protein